MRAWSLDKGFLRERPFSIDKSKLPYFDNIVIPNKEGTPLSLIFYRDRRGASEGPDVKRVEIPHHTGFASGRFNIPLSFPSTVEADRGYDYAFFDPYTGHTRFYIIRTSPVGMKVVEIEDRRGPARVYQGIPQAISDYINIPARGKRRLRTAPEIHYSFDTEGQAFYLLMRGYIWSTTADRPRPTLYLYKMGVNETVAGWNRRPLAFPHHPANGEPAQDVSIRFFSVNNQNIYVGYDYRDAGPGHILLTQYRKRAGVFDKEACYIYQNLGPFMPGSLTTESWSLGRKTGLVSYRNNAAGIDSGQRLQLRRANWTQCAPVPPLDYLSILAVHYNQPDMHILGSVQNQLLLLNEREGNYYRAQVDPNGKIIRHTWFNLGPAEHLMAGGKVPKNKKTAKSVARARKSLYSVFMENKGFLGAGKKKVVKEILLSSKTTRQLKAAGIPIAQRKNTLAATFSNMKGTPIEITLYLNDIPGKKRTFFVDRDTWVDIFVNKANIQTAIKRYPILAAFRYASTQQQK